MKRASTFLNEALGSLPVRKERVETEINQLDTAPAALHESDQTFPQDNILENQVKNTDIWLSQIDEDSQGNVLEDAEMHVENIDVLLEDSDLDDLFDNNLITNPAEF